jgi:CheY-like chemotaxis protein
MRGLDLINKRDRRDTESAYQELAIMTWWEIKSTELKAVHKVEARQKGYNIIFIDITMLILDGFGVTRQIRAIEEKRKKSAIKFIGLGGRDLGVNGARNSSKALSMAQSHTKGTRNPALIIAFTRRSSIEDQTEAVRVGIDLFMTKPVALKEVKKIIDN